jgi:RNA recognition motif-containing protein
MAGNEDATATTNATAAAAAAQSEGTPNATLYIHNLNEKIQPNVVKDKLKMLFSQYGKVSNISVGKKLAAKGQVS